MNPHLQQLKPYPFARLREAMQGITPPDNLHHQKCADSIIGRIVQISAYGRTA